MHTCTGSRRSCGICVAAIWNHVGKSVVRSLLFFFKFSALGLLSFFCFSPTTRLFSLSFHCYHSVTGAWTSLCGSSIGWVAGIANHGSVSLSRSQCNTQCSSILLIPGRLFKFTVTGNNCNICAIVIKLPSRSRRSLFVFICRIIFEKYFIKAIEDFFPSFHSLILTLGGVGRIRDGYANLRLRLGFA